jgi:predicted Holliday junction resolvase-like endonuclease
MYDSYPTRIQQIIRERLDAAHTLQADLRERKRQLVEQKKTRPEKIRVAAVGSNFGKIAEQIIPAFVTFPYKQTECRPLFEPVDYVIFNGLAKRGRVEAIKFVDVKTGEARLSPGQRQIRDRVSEGKVKHRVIGR